MTEMNTQSRSRTLSGGQKDRLTTKLIPTISHTSHLNSVAFFSMDGNNFPLDWRIDILSNLRTKGTVC